MTQGFNHSQLYSRYILEEIPFPRSAKMGAAKTSVATAACIARILNELTSNLNVVGCSSSREFFPRTGDISRQSPLLSLQSDINGSTASSLRDEEGSWTMTRNEYSTWKITATTVYSITPSINHHSRNNSYSLSRSVNLRCSPTLSCSLSLVEKYGWLINEHSVSDRYRKNSGRHGLRCGRRSVSYRRDVYRQCTPNCDVHLFPKGTLVTPESSTPLSVTVRLINGSHLIKTWQRIQAIQTCGHTVRKHISFSQLIQ
ncbi:hypothetical protein CBL_05518 [Carabus blaptoides fortunei]